MAWFGASHVIGEITVQTVHSVQAGMIIGVDVGRIGHCSGMCVGYVDRSSGRRLLTRYIKFLGRKYFSVYV